MHDKASVQIGSDSRCRHYAWYSDKETAQEAQAAMSRGRASHGKDLAAFHRRSQLFRASSPVRRLGGSGETCTAMTGEGGTPPSPIG
eukprot:scaffold16863_cov33-Tisochrysis_lutea.AAC.2